MEVFQSTLGYIRPASTRLPKVLPNDLDKLNEVLLDAYLWFLPIPRGFAANQEPALHMLHSRRIQKAVEDFCEYFEIETPEALSFAESMQFMFQKCPSLESFVFQNHDPKVLNAWIYLMVHHKQLYAKIGPKNDYDDPAFVSKVAQFVPHVQPNSKESWIALWKSLVSTEEEITFQKVLEDVEVTALPLGAIRFNHFVKNYCCDEWLIQNLMTQRHTLYDLGIKSKIANLDAYFWVDPEPVIFDQDKTFRVLVYDPTEESV